MGTSRFLRGLRAPAFHAVLVTLLCALLVGPVIADPEPAAQPPTADPGYRLAAGDKVRITVYGHEDLSGEFEVDGGGRLSLPLIRDVNAAGLTVRELQEAIIAKLKPDYLREPKVSAEVLSYRPFYIIGEVRSPGSYPYVNGMTVINAVAVAGGFTNRANKKKVRVVRGVGQVQQKVDLPLDATVMPGDVIEIRQRIF